MISNKYQACDCDPLEQCEHKQKKKFRLPPLTKEALDRINEVGRIVNEEMKKKMAKYDHGGGCPCGLYKECEPGCREYKESLTSDFAEYNRMLEMNKNAERAEREAYFDRVAKEFPGMYDAPKEKKQLESNTRNWGVWSVLDVDQGYKVKRLEILPDQAISLQYHIHRSEHWTIVQGEGKVIVDGNIFTVKKGESFHVPKMALHRITNTHLTETLIAIEVQMGEICSEEDIVRC